MKVKVVADGVASVACAGVVPCVIILLVLRLRLGLPALIALDGFGSKEVEVFDLIAHADDEVVGEVLCKCHARHREVEGTNLVVFHRSCQSAVESHVDTNEWREGLVDADSGDVVHG